MMLVGFVYGMFFVFGMFLFFVYVVALALHFASCSVWNDRRHSPRSYLWVIKPQ